MNEVQEQFYRAVDILGDALKDTLQYDRTYPATVTEIVDPLLGQYRVRYENSNILARSRSLSDKYRVNDVVFVTEPAVHCADVDTNFYIIGKVKNSALDAADITALQNYTIPVSTNLLEGIVPINYIDGNETKQQNGLIAGCAPLALTAAVTPLTWDESFKITPIIKLEAEFRTELQSEHAAGNYGLRLKFNNNKTYTLDLSSFNGRPYEFNDWAPQSAFFVVEKGMKLTKVEFFQEGMAVDKVWDAATLSWKENTTVPNLFVRNLSLTFVNKKDLTQEEYYLAVSAPQGRYIDENNSITLQARLLNYGEEVTPTTIQWYKKNIDIKNSEDTGYDINLGAMWEALKGEIDTTLALAYVENIDKYQTYKVRVTYKGAGYLSDEISVQAFSANANDFEIERRMTAEEEEELFLSPMGDGKWASLINNTYTILNNGGTTNSIQPVDYGMYYAYVSGIGIKSYNYQSREVVMGDVSGDVSVIWSGQTSYLYNAYGMVDDYTITEKVRQLTAAISWNKDKPASYTVAWEYPTENTLLTKVAATTVTNADTASISYNIASRYKESTNNKLILRIVTAAGDIYTFEKEILFARNGDPGTNGTGYLVYVRPVDNNGNIISSYTYLKNQISTENNPNTIKVKAFIFKNGNQITASSGACNWETSDSAILEVAMDTADNTLCTCALKQALNNNSINGIYVKVHVKVEGQVITAFYPIDVVTNEPLSSCDYLALPRYVQYNAAGYSPNYDSTAIVITSEEAIPLVSQTTDLFTLLEYDGQYRINPVNYFIYANTQKVGLLRLAEKNIQSNEDGTDTEISNTVYHSIVYYLNVYGNENINGWDGQVLIDENNNCIYAAQVGAGYKEDGKFSGVVMGKAALAGETGNIRTGLYGFRNGEAAFGFREDGTGFIGKSGSGRIEFDGNNATISGAGETTSMKLYLNEPENKEAINIANKFKVSYDGKVTLPKAGSISFEDSEGFLTSYTETDPIAQEIANGEWDKGTFISGKMISTPELYVGSGLTSETSQREVLDSTGFRIDVLQYGKTHETTKYICPKVKIGVASGGSWMEPFIRLGLGNKAQGCPIIKKTASALFIGLVNPNNTLTTQGVESGNSGGGGSNPNSTDGDDDDAQTLPTALPKDWGSIEHLQNDEMSSAEAFTGEEAELYMFTGIKISASGVKIYIAGEEQALSSTAVWGE